MKKMLDKEPKNTYSSQLYLLVEENLQKSAIVSVNKIQPGYKDHQKWPLKITVVLREVGNAAGSL